MFRTCQIYHWRHILENSWGCYKLSHFKPRGNHEVVGFLRSTVWFTFDLVVGVNVNFLGNVKNFAPKILIGNELPEFWQLCLVDNKLYFKRWIVTWQKATIILFSHSRLFRQYTYLQTTHSLHTVLSGRVRELSAMLNLDTQSSMPCQQTSQSLHSAALWCIVNNAGYLSPPVVFEMATKEDFRKVMNVNLFGMVDVTRAFLPLLRRGEKGEQKHYCETICR